MSWQRRWPGGASRRQEHSDEVDTDEEIEAKYGDKLNRMLGGISKGGRNETNEE